jgi:hypothetical protein
MFQLQLAARNELIPFKWVEKKSEVLQKKMGLARNHTYTLENFVSFYRKRTFTDLIGVNIFCQFVVV